MGYTWYVALVLYIDDNESGECDDEDRVWSLVTPGVTENLRFEIAPSDSEWGAGNGDCYAAIGPCGP